MTASRESIALIIRFEKFGWGEKVSRRTLVFMKQSTEEKKEMYDKLFSDSAIDKQNETK
jgi:hypothetical protein